MSRFFNVDIDKTVGDLELSYQNANDSYKNEIKQLNDNFLNIISLKKNEYNNKMKQIADLKNKIIEHHDRLQHLTNKIECEQETIKTETDRLECIGNECSLLEIKENDLKNMINEKKTELNQIIKEKKESFKKFKRELNTFKSGVNIYEKFLQLSMSINNESKIAVINISLRNYNVVFEEYDDYFKLIDISPRSGTVIQAAELYNQNKDVQGLLAFLYNTKE